MGCVGDVGYHLLIDQAGVVYEGRHSGTDGVPVFGGPAGRPYRFYPGLPAVRRDVAVTRV